MGIWHLLQLPVVPDTGLLAFWFQARIWLRIDPRLWAVAKGSWCLWQGENTSPLPQPPYLWRWSHAWISPCLASSSIYLSRLHRMEFVICACGIASEARRGKHERKVDKRIWVQPLINWLGGQIAASWLRVKRVSLFWSPPPLNFLKIPLPVPTLLFPMLSGFWSRRIIENSISISFLYIINNNDYLQLLLLNICVTPSSCLLFAEPITATQLSNSSQSQMIKCNAEQGKIGTELPIHGPQQRSGQNSKVKNGMLENSPKGFPERNSQVELSETEGGIWPSEIQTSVEAIFS